MEISCAPADLPVLKERIGRLMEWMADNRVDLAWIGNPVYRRYLVDEEAEGRACSLLVVDQSGSITQISGEGQGASHADGLEIDIVTFVDYSINEWAAPAENALKRLSEQIQRRRPRRMGFDYYAQSFSGEILNALAGIELMDVRGLLNGMRLKKAAYEVERIRRAGLVNKLAYDAIRARPFEGMTEFELFARMTEQAIGRARYPVTFIGRSDLISGERCMQAGGAPTNKIIRSGDSVIVDLFPTVHGYHADNCRTFIAGRPSPLQQEIHATVMLALQKAESLLVPDNRVNEIFREANEILKGIAHSFSLFHHLGHGVGVQDQEAPYLIPGSQEILEEGMVVSVEPGIYVKGQGVRIENVYYIGGSGPENLTPFNADF